MSKEKAQPTKAEGLAFTQEFRELMLKHPNCFNQAEIDEIDKELRMMVEEINGEN